MPKVNYTTPTGDLVSVEGKNGVSLMRLAKKNNVDGIVAVCGGHAECGTCHVYVDEEFADKIPDRKADEVAMLEEVAAERKPNSRLSCQIKLNDELDGISVTVAPKQQ